MNRKRKDLKVLKIVIALIVLIVLGYAGWRMWLIYQESKPKPVVTNKIETVVDTEEEFTYKYDETHLTYRFPEHWKNEVKQAVITDKKWQSIKGIITSPSGNEILWHYSVVEDAPVACKTSEDDEPFSAENGCPTREILSFEKTQDTQKPANWSNGMPYLFKERFYLTRTKFTEGKGGDQSPQYTICLNAYMIDEEPKKGVKVGPYVPCLHKDGGFEARYEVKNMEGFDDEETRQAETILHSFSVFE